MGKTITVRPNQSMLDIVLMGCGTLEGGMQMMLANNGRSISDIPNVGDEVNLETEEIKPLSDAGVLQYLRQQKIVIGTAGVAYEPPAPELEVTIVLKPVLTAIATSSAPIMDHYSIALDGNNLMFINQHALITDYLIANPLKYEAEDRYLAGFASANVSPDATTPMTAKHIPYSIPWDAGHGMMMCWDANPTPVKTVTFEDVAGNTAYYSPLVALQADANIVKACLAPDLLVEVVSSTDTEATLRLTRSHSPLPLPDLSSFNDITLNWIYTGVVGVPDPADPGNPDKILLVRPVGNHTFGVKATYRNSALMISYPASQFTMVVNIG